MAHSISRHLRSQALYRTLSAPGGNSRWACGFGLKPDSGGYARPVAMEYIAVYVLRGSGEFAGRQGRHRVSAGCFCQHVPGAVYSLQPDYDGRWAEAYIAIDGPLYEHLARLGAIDGSRDILEPGIRMSLVERFEQMLQDLEELPDSSIHITIAHCVELLVHVQHLERSVRVTDDAGIVDRACQRLGADVSERIALPQLAEELGVGYDRFRKLFSASTGVSPGEYRIRRRIDRARELILHHNRTSREIADTLGYPDPFTFSKQFKRTVGESPDTFRRRMFGGRVVAGSDRS